MASYRLQIKPSAVKDLEALPVKDRRRVVSRIQGLATNPRSAGGEKLSGQELYRVGRGNYRILYSVQDTDLVVIIIRIGHRREVYR